MEGKESVLDVSLLDNTAEQLFNLNSNIKSLVEYSKLLGMIKDRRSTRMKINKLRTNINDEIFVITTNVRILKQEATKGDKVIEIQTGKMEDTFVSAIGKYKEAQKEILKKERYDIHSMIMDVNVVNRKSFRKDETVKLRRASQMLKTIKIEEEKLLNNQQRILETHRDIVEIHEIMAHLSNMVHEQGNAIDEVEEIITRADFNLQTGAEELNAASGKRWCSIRRTLISVLVLAAVTIFVVALGMVSFF